MPVTGIAPSQSTLERSTPCPRSQSRRFRGCHCGIACNSLLPATPHEAADTDAPNRDGINCRGIDVTRRSSAAAPIATTAGSPVPDIAAGARSSDWPWHVSSQPNRHANVTRHSQGASSRVPLAVGAHSAPLSSGEMPGRQLAAPHACESTLPRRGRQATPDSAAACVARIVLAMRASVQPGSTSAWRNRPASLSAPVTRPSVPPRRASSSLPLEGKGVNPTNQAVPRSPVYTCSQARRYWGCSRAPEFSEALSVSGHRRPCPAIAARIALIPSLE